MNVEAAPRDIPRAVGVTVALFLASFVLVIALGKLSWVLPVTYFHGAALAYLQPRFSFARLSNPSTQLAFVVLGILSLAMAAAETSSLTKEEGTPVPTQDNVDVPQPGTQIPPASDTAPRKSPAPSPVPAPTPVPKQSPAPTRPAPVSVKEVSTTVDEILQIYAANQIAGKRKFANARTTISGRAVRVREALGTGILVLGSPRSGKSLELVFAESGEASLAAVSPGQSVKAVCHEVIEMMGEVVVTDCRTVN